ncbi:hypothetical protein [Pseudalkalibacillus caeni]|uniref:Uncharacterized protein n=1 Tax=Exobacillus caeni TaxID=2574798 RepID=A0A5R9EY16_9BACL|nr:hypothetical protein [Pseudalkalibacillus caeni]TLS35997.1 hypothetical protein FCL54_17545 [Pseudalkalibacillus caeni]
MNKKTTVKWFSGITTAVVAATFIGFVQNHQLTDNSNAVRGEEWSVDAEESYREASRYGNGENNQRLDGFEDHRYGEEDEYEDHEFGEGEYQGMEPSDRRTRHS